jgi:O-antigen ligase
LIRLGLLAIFCTFLCFYSFVDWYRSLCGLVLLTAVIEHPDMPKNILGIQGANPWNIVLLFVLLAFFVNGRSGAAREPVPAYYRFLMTAYGAVVLVGFARMVADRGHLPENMGIASIVSEYLVNTVKWVVPGYLFFRGCDSEKRFRMALLAVVGFHFLLAVQIIRWIPPSYALKGSDLAERSIKILQNEIGFHRVNLAMLMAGGSWALLAARPAMTSRAARNACTFGFLACTFAVALTAGRMGYLAWLVAGALFSLLRWRKALLLLPVLVVAVVTLLPGTYGRFTAGFSEETRDHNPLVPGASRKEAPADGSPDLYTVTAGRNVAWPYVIDAIGRAPLAGYGRLAMNRTGISAYLAEKYREYFAHPHNAYLEITLDNGILGGGMVILFYLSLLARAGRGFTASRDPVGLASSGVLLALLVALLVAAFGSQTFYPREGAVSLWGAIGLFFASAGRAGWRLDGPSPRPAWRFAKGGAA